MKYITYLIGAGASYHSLPLIKTMGQRMKAFSTFLKMQLEKGLLTHKLSADFIKALENIIEIGNNRTTLDAYAGQLAISNDSESKHKLKELKVVLSSYYIFEQMKKPDGLTFYTDEFELINSNKHRIRFDDDMQNMIKTYIDKRYFTFWVDYLKEHQESLNKNINIISWNYDMQFEYSFAEIKQYSLLMAQQNLQVYPSEVTQVDSSKSCILKLNGTAGLYESISNKYFNLFDLGRNNLIETLNSLIAPFETIVSKSPEKPLFLFAWENENIVNNTRKIAKDIIKKTNVLVVIGYSFPTFNTTVDRSIFEDLDNLERIYYQAPKDEIDGLMYKLDRINPLFKRLVTPITDISTFHIPNEFWED